MAILAGMHHCKGDSVVFMAGDMQDPPELIESLIAEWQNGQDVVWAVRENIVGISVVSKFFSKLFYFLMNSFANVKFPPSGADFALIDKKVVNAVLESAGSNPSLGGLITSVGFKQSEITYVKQARAFGKSKWTLNKKSSIYRCICSIFIRTYANHDLYWNANFYNRFHLCNFYNHSKVVFIKQIDGWASLMVAVLFLGGIQMLMIGTLGEYLWRNLEESRKKTALLLKKSNKIQ
ncbi:MAG: glycosyltransferase [Bacteroidetes bacterium]|nr:glycosyltransferase [Bacteroidota bacterium]